MLFYSTNKKSPPVNFETALMQGLAPDGGLYYPETFPKFSQSELNNLSGASLQAVAFTVLNRWIGDEVEETALREIVNKALDFPIPLKKVGPYHVLELFHGPTMAFKDVAAKCLAQLTNYFLQKRGKKATVLVATSGDTGGAVAQGFAGVENVNVVVLFPKGKVSKLQEEQLTRVADNVMSIEVDGVFDDCQAMVKRAFLEASLQSLNLTSANSINIGRLLPQIVYFAYAYTVLKDDNLEFVIPAGNMGNSTTGLFAWKMGVPIRSFILATNLNDAVAQYAQTGIYKAKATIQTLSNAMDVGNPSNFVRVLEFFNYDHDAFKRMVKVTKVDDATTAATLKRVYQDYQYLLDPHTAVAWSAAEQLKSSKYTQVIILTASPLKFAEEIKDATGIAVSDTEAINKLKHLPKRKHEIKNNYLEFTRLLTSLPAA